MLCDRVVVAGGGSFEMIVKLLQECLAAEEVGRAEFNAATPFCATVAYSVR